ncbi:uncharacterized protein MYCFIDRAFT_211571 [Pseudocercospora fijiensis CIRAD86]|uniref:Uncharacterized protein n=1 Tax=Pseudocercospora fijiensis (strain CIRAD86) TaxID=383855 RepID=M2ZT73_PSEFD|nr:uncharacterized protein MYCFIDRAFT_211571 [Pseudocercospora fijiensis CIRAD86]EME82214.1 hypothetical protein MYCFIDRAFT_211571 [Pseudocercospora fijiensis CIRAD86]
MPAESLIVKALVIDLASSWGTSDCFMSLEGLEDLGQTPGFFIAFTREIFSGEGGTKKVREPFCDYEISEFLV